MRASSRSRRELLSKVLAALAQDGPTTPAIVAVTFCPSQIFTEATLSDQIQGV